MYFFKGRVRRILLFFLLYSSFGYAQQAVVEGKVSDKEQDVIAGAPVLLKSYPEGEILAYRYTNREGYYFFDLSTYTDTLLISVSALQYHPKKQLILNENQIVNFELLQDSILLEEVIVRPSPITAQGDI